MAMNAEGIDSEDVKRPCVSGGPLADHGYRSWLVSSATATLLLATVGATYLAVTALLGGAVAGCGPESGCNRVLSSRWAYWLGLPVSVPAVVVYIVLLAGSRAACNSTSPRVQRVSRQVVLALSLLVLAAALWFFAVQKLIIHAWCKWCLATHASAAMASCLLLVNLFTPRRSEGMRASLVVDWRNWARGVCVAMLGVATLVAGQVLVKKRLYAITLFGSSRAAAGLVCLYEGRFQLDPKELPILGSAAATNFVVSLFDYTCSHCRALHPLLKAAAEEYKERLGILALPAPLDAECNPLILLTAEANQNACEYARLGLAVWRAKHEAFDRFDDFMFRSASPPSLDQARAYAEELVGKDGLESALHSPWIARQLETDVALYEANAWLVGDSRLPQLVVGGVILHGTIESREELLALIEHYTGLRPIAALETKTRGRSQRPPSESEARKSVNR